MNGMKRIVLILVMAVAGLCGTVEAQTFRDRSGSYTGRIEASGTVRDRSGSYVGKVSVEGFVNVASVAGEKCMPIVDAECVEVDGKRCACKIAICDNNFGDYDLILQHSMF